MPGLNIRASWCSDIPRVYSTKLPRTIVVLSASASACVSSAPWWWKTSQKQGSRKRNREEEICMLTCSVWPDSRHADCNQFASARTRGDGVTFCSCEYTFHNNSTARPAPLPRTSVHIENETSTLDRHFTEFAGTESMRKQKHSDDAMVRKNTGSQAVRIPPLEKWIPAKSTDSLSNKRRINELCY